MEQTIKTPIKSDGPTVLLVNPHLHDFSAFDLWSKPLGLLYLAAVLREGGYRVHWLDCLDIHFPGVQSGLPLPKRRPDGTGGYYRERLPKPPVLKDVPRYFYRYGIPPELFVRSLKEIPPPEAVLVTSGMTYWYPGVRETMALVRKVFPSVPVILGGWYASLMPGHARSHTGTDYLITGAGEGAILNLLRDLTGWSAEKVSDPRDLDSLPFPAFDLYEQRDYVCLLTSRGCPYACPYCASRGLQPEFRQRSPENIVEELRHWHRGYGVRDFAFYDDALLIDFEHRLGPVLERVLTQGWDIRFHTPNAVHVREIDRAKAELMRRAGFRTLRLGVETTNWDRQEDWGGKVGPVSLGRAVEALTRAGFPQAQMEGYLLVGIPGQPVEEIRGSIEALIEMGLRPRLAEFSPIPGTPLWPEACRVSRFPLEEDPLFHNNSLFPCLSPFSWHTVQAFKDLARG